MAESIAYNTRSNIEVFRFKRCTFHDALESASHQVRTIQKYNFYSRPPLATPRYSTRPGRGSRSQGQDLMNQGHSRCYYAPEPIIGKLLCYFKPTKLT
jgi:hypothetical protein